MIISALFGFLASLVPEITKQFQDRKDKEHEITLLKLQIAAQERQGAQQLDAVGLQAEAQESVALYQTFHTKIKWVDAYNGTVRPTITYALFSLYAGVKIWMMVSLDWPENPLPWQVDIIANRLISDFDKELMAAIFGFYFGQRAFRKR